MRQNCVGDGGLERAFPYYPIRCARSNRVPSPKRTARQKCSARPHQIQDPPPISCQLNCDEATGRRRKLAIAPAVISKGKQEPCGRDFSKYCVALPAAVSSSCACLRSTRPTFRRNLIQLAESKGIRPADIAEYVDAGLLLCARCMLRYPIAHGLPLMLPYVTRLHEEFDAQWKQPNAAKAILRTAGASAGRGIRARVLFHRMAGVRL